MNNKLISFVAIHFLSLKVPFKIVADMILCFGVCVCVCLCVCVFQENEAWHYMRIIYSADNLHKMSSLIFSKN